MVETAADTAWNRSDEEDDRGAGEERPGEGDRWESVARWITLAMFGVILMILGLLGGLAMDPGIIHVDVYWTEGPWVEPRYVKSETVRVGAGEEIRVEAPGEGEAILVLCAPLSGRNPCGREGPQPSSRSVGSEGELPR